MVTGLLRYISVLPNRIRNITCGNWVFFTVLPQFKRATVPVGPGRIRVQQFELQRELFQEFQLKEGSRYKKIDEKYVEANTAEIECALSVI
jgi:hypothetical protein